MTRASAEWLQAALASANRARAMFYVSVLRALERRMARESAQEILREAIHDWGAWLGGSLEAHAPAGFDGLRRDFVEAPDGGIMFSPAVAACDDEGLDVQFMTCPLKEAWQDAGLADEDVALLCSLASAADVGTLERAGFTVSIETWTPGTPGCCKLRIRRAQDSRAA